MRYPITGMLLSAELAGVAGDGGSSSSGLQINSEARKVASLATKIGFRGRCLLSREMQTDKLRTPEEANSLAS
jgi:hypothetical protein